MVGRKVVGNPSIHLPALLPRSELMSTDECAAVRSFIIAVTEEEYENAGVLTCFQVTKDSTARQHIRRTCFIE